MDIKILDFVSFIIVVGALIIIPRMPLGWLLYSLGCFTYIYINLRKGLVWQAILNIVAAIIALLNYGQLR